MQPREIGFLQGAGAGVDETQRANTAPVVENKRAAGIEPNSRVIGDQGIVVKSRVLECGDATHEFAMIDDVGTKCGVARSLFRIEAVARFEPLSVLVDQTDKCDWHIKERSGQARDSIKPVLWLGFEDPHLAKLFRPPLPVFRYVRPLPAAFRSQLPRVYLGAPIASLEGFDQPVRVPRRSAG